MKVLIITSSPNKDGLTAACGNAAKEGAEKAGAEASIISLNDLGINNCNVCNNGWGSCKLEGECQVEDDFQKVHKSIAEADALVVVSPVYWGDLSEPAKVFFDRLRRCEAYNKEKNNLEGKPVICVAAAGGSGNGTITCLSTMERLFIHMRAERFDLITITRKTRSYKLETINSAAAAMVQSIK